MTTDRKYKQNVIIMWHPILGNKGEKGHKITEKCTRNKRQSFLVGLSLSVSTREFLISIFQLISDFL